MVLRYEEEPSLFPRPPACRMLLERKAASVNSIHAVACNYLKIKNHYHCLAFSKALKVAGSYFLPMTLESESTTV